MKSIAVTVALLAAILSFAAPAAADTCSGQNRLCLAWCKTNRPTAACTADCASRMAACLQTGSYHWSQRPTVNGLQKR